MKKVLLFGGLLMDRYIVTGRYPRRGEDTLRYGPLKPRGLRDPATGREPYAVVQLRRDNAEGSIYNLVGFQTHLKFGEQKIGRAHV